MKKLLSVAAVLLSATGLSQAEETVVVPNPIEARTFFEVDAGLVSLNKSQASSQGYSDSGYSVSGSAGIILGYFRGGIGAVGILPSDQDANSLVDEDGYAIAGADIAFTGFSAFGGGRYLYLNKYEFNLDVGLTTTGHFQVSNVVSEQEASLETTGGLFIRPSFNYYVTSFFGLRASYLQMIGSDTTTKSILSAGAVFKL